MSRKVEGERLDVVLEKLRQSGDPGAVFGPQVFEDILGSARLGDRKSERERWLKAQIADFIIPHITEPSIFHASRSIPLLDHFLIELWPILFDKDGDEEAGELAWRLINDEKSRLQDVLDRVNEGISA